MAYTAYTWQNGSDGGTPITAYRLNQLETNLAAVSETADMVLPGKTTEYTAVTSSYSADNLLRWDGTIIGPSNFASATFAVILSTTPTVNRSALFIITTGSSSIGVSTIGESDAGFLGVALTSPSQNAYIKTSITTASIVRATVIKLR